MASTLMKFKDICEKIGSGATPKGGKGAYTTQGISLIRSQNVLDFTFSYDGLAYINEQQAEKLNNVIIERGDVLLNITGDSVARACMVPDEVLPARVNQHVLIIRGKSDCVLGSYLLYYLQMLKPVLLQLASGGATRNALTKGMLEELEIAVPTISEQKKIVSIIDDIQEKIKNNTNINDNLLQQSLCIYSEMIGSRSKDGCIGDYCSIKSGFAFKSKWWQDSGVPVIKIGSINQDYLNLSDCSYVSEDKISLANDFIVGGGDLLIAMTGATIGKFTMVPKVSKTILVNQRVGKFFLGDNPISRLPFIYCTLKQPEIVSEVINRGQGSAQPNISASDIMSIPCVIPPTEVIDEFNKSTSQMFELIINNQYENSVLANTRDSILPKLMSGELDVSELNL